VSVVASAMQNGTSEDLRQSLREQRLAEPVGPISRMLLFSISTSANGSAGTQPDESAGGALWRTRLKCCAPRRRASSSRCPAR
jgi:hypothetical protein